MEKVIGHSGRPVRIEIDLNSRTSAGYTRTRITRADGPIDFGDHVLAFESDDEVVADAIVIDLDRQNNFAYLSVDWSSMRDDVTRTARVHLYGVFPAAGSAWQGSRVHKTYTHVTSPKPWELGSETAHVHASVDQRNSGGSAVLVESGNVAP